MELKIEGSNLQTLLEKATLEALGDAGREALVKEVVRYLVTAESYRNESPLRLAMRSAAAGVAQRVLAERIANDPAFVEAIESLYVDAFKKFHDAESREKLVARMAERLSSAFDKDY